MYPPLFLPRLITINTCSSLKSCWMANDPSLHIQQSRKKLHSLLDKDSFHAKSRVYVRDLIFLLEVAIPVVQTTQHTHISLVTDCNTFVHDQVLDYGISLTYAISRYITCRAMTETCPCLRKNEWPGYKLCHKGANTSSDNCFHIFVIPYLYECHHARFRPLNLRNRRPPAFLSYMSCGIVTHFYCST